MNICGVDLDSNGACLVTINQDLEVVSKSKILIGNHEEKSELIKFSEQMSTYLIENNIDQVVIKKRALKGKFVGSPISFKMETLIQLMSFPVSFITAAKISSDVKRKGLKAPDGLFKYMHAAYYSAHIGVTNEKNVKKVN